jgi:hypothetical protein
LFGAGVEGNNVVGRSNRVDGPALVLSRNNSGWVVRGNVCDGEPCHHPTVRNASHENLLKMMPLLKIIPRK